MAVATTTDFILTRDQLLSSAVRKIKGINAYIENEDLKYGAEALNMVVKSLQNHSVLLWTTEWSTKPLTAASIVEGSDGKQYTCRLSHTSASSNVPITGSDYTTYWEQTGTSGSAVALGTAYNSIGDFSLDLDVVGIHTAYRRRDGTDNPLKVIPWLDYQNIYDKFQTGDPIKIAFKRDRDGIAKAFMWPQPDNTDDVIHLEIVRKLKDFDTGSDNPDFPQRWYEYLIYQTAYRMAPEYRLPLNERQMLKKDAEECFILARKPEFESTDDDFISPA